MLKYFIAPLCLFQLMGSSGTCQTVDTLVDVGGYRLYFHIVKGTGMPILFESGSGVDVTMWDPVLKPIADATHATLITYDRAGFGKSELDTTNDDVDKHGILDGITGLESGLKKLGYDSNIMLVASSFGGFCATLYAARHPATVKTAVFIDANHVCWFVDDFVDREMKERKKNSESMKKDNLAYYYQALNLQNTVELMRKTPFPATVPVVDLVSEFNFPDSVSAARWKLCHKEFAEAQPNREGITAYGCGHIIFRDNPVLVINAISKAYMDAFTSAQDDEKMTQQPEIRISR